MSIPDSDTASSTDIDRLTWYRRTNDAGEPIVGYACTNCGHEIEHRYQPSLLRRCPNCGGNPQGVRQWEVEPLVEERRQRLREQLAARYGIDLADGADATCAVCGTTEDVHVDPGETFEDLEWRCDEHRLFEHRFWWQAGDHPGLLARDWIATCDACGAEFTALFGVTFADYDTEYRRDECLQCVDPDEVRRWCEDAQRRRERRASA